jgi:4-hydroxythreonine-4-phosphate dehydrogenase
MAHKQPIVLTSGDPSGIGPEIACKAWQVLREDVPFIFVGDPRHLSSEQPFELISNCAEAIEIIPNAMPVLEHKFAVADCIGGICTENAKDVVAVIERAVALVQSGDARAVCTNPINKKILQDGAGFAYPGHTEFLAHLGGVQDVVMMLASPQLRVVPATIHIALKDVPDALTRASLAQTIKITEQALVKQFGISEPRIAIAGLNPHAGEGGKMGDEELAFIGPLIKELKNSGMTIFGPLPADTMFHERARAGYDVAICMYHDQALIPIKTLDFDRGVNVTLGLPFVRTSPDHGTAFDIAGQNIANPSSLIEALRLADRLSQGHTA